MILDINKDLLEQIKQLHGSLRPLKSQMGKFQIQIAPFKEQFKKIWDIQVELQKTHDRLKANPEYNFIQAFHNIEYTQVQIEYQEELLNKYLPDLLIKFDLINLWVGADYALKTSTKENPEKIRHFLASLRAMVEYSINGILAPDDKVRQWDKYEILWKEHLKKQGHTENCNNVNIPKYIKIKYFCSKIEFVIYDDFAASEVSFINELYGNLSKLHSFEITLDDNDLKRIRIKVGTLLWLFLTIHNLNQTL